MRFKQMERCIVVKKYFGVRWTLKGFKQERMSSFSLGLSKQS